MLGLKKGDEVVPGSTYREAPDMPFLYDFTPVEIALMLEVGLLMKDEPASDWNEEIIPPSRLQLEKERETPWKPKDMDVYYTLTFDYRFEGGVKVDRLFWENGNDDRALMKQNLVFPTQSAALAKAEEIRKVLKK